MNYDTASELYEYNSDTGTISHKCNKRGGKKAGDVATGKVTSTGYLRVSHANSWQLAHRVAWMLHHSQDIPNGMTVDHINGERTDNRASNLRLLSRAHNCARLDRAKGFSKVKGGWRAQVRHKGIRKYGTLRTCPLLARIDYLDITDKSLSEGW